jgi:pimeloyl-ACP methyl ester carboxylesterase
MYLTVNGVRIFAGTGGKDFDPALPAIVFLHGGGCDHTVWALLARWFAHRGYAVLAADLPGHGCSGGEVLGSIAAMADWTAALISASGAGKAALVGHSMGALIALEAAARHPDKVPALALIGAAAAMPVSGDLLTAAEANDHAAIDMVSIWGNGFAAGLGGALVPGAWMVGGTMRLLERAKPSALFKDLSACNAYGDGLASAAKVTVPAMLVLGERDLMTPLKGGLKLADTLPQAHVVTLKGAGHMLLSERPDEVLAAIKDFAA